MSAEAATTEVAKTPFTVITGFLGAGKTTLINYILTEQSQKRICVIENEFGEINIDEKLISDNIKAKEDLVTMDNGCACCSVRGDLVRTLGMIAEKRHQFDAVFLETTGLADPAPIINTIKSNQFIEDNFIIDAVICVADAKHVKQHMDEVKPDGAVNEAVQQVVFADRILLNKVDIVSKDELAAIRDTVTSINNFAKIIPCERSRCDLNELIGINSFSIDRCTELDPELFDGTEGGGKRHDLSMVSSCGISMEGLYDVTKFNVFMAALLQERAKDIYRSKGVLAFEGQGNQKFVFQGVHEQIDFGPASSEWKEDEPKVNKLVFIGRNINRAELTASLTECLAAPPAAEASK